jgi:hypothetical protein
MFILAGTLAISDVQRSSKVLGQAVLGMGQDGVMRFKRKAETTAKDKENISAKKPVDKGVVVTKEVPKKKTKKQMTLRLRNK